jgi:1-aminocyclopropane-1-carboxylate deaminase/D-cysteine desulfhydrase-like pyridoxal-dependent ACC family enzyme
MNVKNEIKAAQKKLKEAQERLSKAQREKIVIRSEGERATKKEEYLNLCAEVMNLEDMIYDLKKEIGE